MNNNANEKSISKNENVKGLGGWLILVILVIFYSAYSYGSLAVKSINYFANGGVQQLSVIPGYAGLITAEIVMEILLFLFLLYLIFLFFKKNTLFPKLFISFTVANLVFAAFHVCSILFLHAPNEGIKVLLQAQLQTGYEALGIAVVGAIIWIAYMKLSERVRSTFVQ